MSNIRLLRNPFRKGPMLEFVKIHIKSQIQVTHIIKKAVYGEPDKGRRFTNVNRQGKSGVLK